MQNVKMTAIRQTKGDYGHISPGEQFETTEEIATILEARGTAMRGAAAKKMESAPQNKALGPFSNKSAKQ